MISERAPNSLASLIVNPVPIQVSIGDQALDLQFRKVGPSLLEGRCGEVVVSMGYDYSEEYPVLNWNVRIGNRSEVPIRDLSIVPLFLRLRIDPAKHFPRVRHMTGSYHYDGTYPPRAFRLSEERIMTHDHCKPVRIESPDLGSAGHHVPVLQFAVGPQGSMAGFYVGFEWSAHWHIEAGWERDSFQGEARPAFLLEGNVGLTDLQLEPGEWLEMPTVHVGFAEGTEWSDFDDALKRYVRECLGCKLNCRIPFPPVSCDHWFGIHRSFDVSDLKRQADRAAELGCEYFCLDAGWYTCAADWGSGIGNWWTS